MLQELSQEITPSGRVECALESSDRSLVELAESVVAFAAANPNGKIAVEAIGQKDAALAGSRTSVRISVVCSSSDPRFTTRPQSVEMEYEGVPLPFLTKMQPATLSMVGGSMVTILGKHLPARLTVHVNGVEVQPSFHGLPCEQPSVHIRVCWQFQVSGGLVVRAVLVNHTSELLHVINMSDGASRRSMHQASAFDSWMRNASNTSRFADALTRRPQPTLADEPTNSGMGSGAVFSGNASQAMLNTKQVCTPSARLSAVASNRCA